MHVPDPEFSIEIRTDGGSPVVVVAGELDFATSNQLREALATLARDEHGRVTLDLGGVGFIDSVGLSVLVQAKKRFDAATQALEIVNVGGTVRSTIDVAGATDFFEIS